MCTDQIIWAYEIQGCSLPLCLLFIKGDGQTSLGYRKLVLNMVEF